MKIQILSDIRLEIERQGSAPGQQFYHYDIPVNAEHLLHKYKVVYFVSGNHEPYRSTIEESAPHIESFANEVTAVSPLEDFVFFNRTRHDIPPEVTILGCTLWSALNPDDLDILSWSLTDFRRIGSFNPDAYTALHRADLTWLNAAVAEIAAVVSTHHAPTVQDTGDPRFLGQPTNSAFRRS